MRGGAFVLCVLLLGATVPAAADGGALGLTDATFDLAGLGPGETRVLRTTVQNSFERSLDVDVEASGAMAPFVVVTPARFTIDAARTREVRIEIALPADLPPASYAGTLRFIGDSVGTPDGTGNALRTAIGVSLGVAFGEAHVASVRIVPASLDLSADDRAPRTFAVTAEDSSGQAVVVDPARYVVWTVDPAAGSFVGNVFHPSGRAGLFTVRATFVGGHGVEAVAPMRVAPGVYARLEAMPPALTLARGGTADIVVRAFDASGNALPTPPLRWTSASAPVAPVDARGQVTGIGIGTTTIHAVDDAHGLSVGVAATVIRNTRPVAALRVSPASATVAAGTQQIFSVEAVDDAGVRVDGAPVSFALQNVTLGDVDASGMFSARRVGATTLVARSGSVEATAEVTVVPGDLAQIQLVPEASFLAPGGSTRFVATGMDAQGNIVDGAPVTWTLVDGDGGTLSDDGLYVAGASGVARVVATSGVVSREAIVFQDSAAVGGGEVEAAVATSSADAMSTATYVAGLASVEPETETLIRAPPSDAEGPRLESATMTVERPATNLAISIDLQPGSFDVVPPEVDPSDLAASRATSAPALFISVHASEDGEALDSAALNDVLATLEVRFDVPEAYFTASGLDPTTLHLVEYSEGRLVRDDIATTLLTPAPVGGRYAYVAVLDGFSAFAVVAAELPLRAPPPPAGGSGGGGAPALLQPADAPAPRVAFSLARDGRACVADVPCRERSWTVALAVNVLGLDPDRTWTYAWDLGDGTTSEDAVPSHRYAMRGVHLVAVDVFDGVTHATGRQPVLVEPPLAVDVVTHDGTFEVSLGEPVRSVDVLLAGELVRRYEVTTAPLRFSDPRAEDDGRSLVLDVTDMLGEVHHVILPAARVAAPAIAEVLEPASAPASGPARSQVPVGDARGPSGPAGEPAPASALPIGWWAGFAALAATVGLALGRFALRRQDDDDRT